jgi:hypothetical protein
VIAAAALDPKKPSAHIGALGGSEAGCVFPAGDLPRAGPFFLSITMNPPGP